MHHLKKKQWKLSLQKINLIWVPSGFEHIRFKDELKILLPNMWENSLYKQVWMETLSNMYKSKDFRYGNIRYRKQLLIKYWNKILIQKKETVDY